MNEQYKNFFKLKIINYFYIKNGFWSAIPEAERKSLQYRLEFRWRVWAEIGSKTSKANKVG